MGFRLKDPTTEIKIDKSRCKKKKEKIAGIFIIEKEREKNDSIYFKIFFL
jgi:hypothetical protein